MNETQEALCVAAFKRALKELDGLGNLPRSVALTNAAQRHARAELPKPGPGPKTEEAVTCCYRHSNDKMPLGGFCAGKYFPEPEPRRGRPERTEVPTTSLFPPAVTSSSNNGLSAKTLYSRLVGRVLTHWNALYPMQQWVDVEGSVDRIVAELQEFRAPRSIIPMKESELGKGNLGNLVHVSAEGPFHDWTSRPPIEDLDV